MTKEIKMENVAVIGASPDKDRYANQAMCLLSAHGHTPVPVAPKHETIEGKQVYGRLSDVPGKIDTVTLYVSPARQQDIIEQILQTAPRRVIFNPNTENPAVYPRLKAAGIEVKEACTLVLLKTNQF